MTKAKTTLALFLATLLTGGLAAAQDGREATEPSPGPGTEVVGPCTTIDTITATPYTDTSDSCAGTNVVSDYVSANCNTLMYPGPELTYEIVVGAANSGIVMTLTPAAADMGIFLVDTCGAGTSCIAFNDAIGGGVVSDIAQTNPAGADMIPAPLAPASYFIYIDSYYAVGNPLSCGTYTLDVMGMIPVKLLSFDIG